MILTITANAALDRVIFIPEFQATTVMRAQRVRECVGGKGFDTSVVLQALGVSQLAMGFVAGEVGKRLRELLEAYSIPHDLVWVTGETRIAHVIVETSHQRHSHIITPGYKLSIQDQAKFMERFRQQVRQASWVVCAGSVPEHVPDDFYRTIVEVARQAGAQTLIDSSRAFVLQATPAKPAILKMNRSEFGETFGETFGISSDSMAELNHRARQIIDREDLPAIVITCGKDGILAITQQGSWLANSPRQQEVNAAGAGDAVSAVLAWRFSEKDDWPAALKMAAATSAAVVLTEGTADCRLEDVERIYQDTLVRQLP
ncbi:MAG: hypothetical protein A2Z16_16325 [Chloroflexi bacterium RBG_16_54_18]|nr:MAG: hypothetical protein A2Z16_16325 [Chloroflexi bacterium RBG_16_54_18]